MMKRFKYLLPVVLILVLAATTFVERRYGTDFVHERVYSTPWFVALWSALMVGVAFSVARFARRREWLNALSHGSFLLIFVGAMCTFLTASSSVMHLRMNVPERVTPDANFTLTLTDFQVLYYPGTGTPSDFVSKVTIQGRDTTEAIISMNHILRYDGYRFFQTSFDPDHEGSVLTVNRDPWGIGFTYAGYALFAVVGLFLLVRRFSARSVAVVSLLLAFAWNGQVKAATPVVPRSFADSVACEQIIYNGRVAPFNTLARDIVVKTYGKASFNGLSSEQVILSFLAYRQQWMDQRFIKVKHDALRDSLGLRNAYASVNDLYDSLGNYKLQRWYSDSAMDKSFRNAIEQTDEKLALLTMLSQGTLFQPLAEGNEHRLSDARVEAEMAYNAIPLPNILFKVCLTLGLLAFLTYFIAPRWFVRVSLPLSIINALVLLALTGYVVLRTYISGHLPLSNGYETMLFIAWLLSLASVALCHYSSLVVAAGPLLCGFSLLVCSISGMNPQITSLMPVLASPWMTIHVTVVMLAYALFALAALLALTRVVRRLVRRFRKCGDVMRTLADDDVQSRAMSLLLVAEYLLGVGIALGSVWANVSWGAYWSWDPKEVWALITFLAYGVVLHRYSDARRSSRKGRHDLWLDLLTLAAFLLLLMTYFGVNVLFSGLHSYA